MIDDMDTWGAHAGICEILNKCGAVIGQNLQRISTQPLLSRLTESYRQRGVCQPSACMPPI